MWLGLSALATLERIADNVWRRVIMRTIMSALLGLSVIAGLSASVSAADWDCKVTRWNDSIPGQHPIFVCPDGKTVG
jgi:hypothetical protein